MSEEERTITQVQDDAAFRAATASVPFDGEAEVRSLRNIFDGETSAATRTACLALGNQEKLTAARRIWEPWRDDPGLGDAIRKVVTDRQEKVADINRRRANGREESSFTRAPRQIP